MKPNEVPSWSFPTRCDTPWRPMTPHDAPTSLICEEILKEKGLPRTGTRVQQILSILDAGGLSHHNHSEPARLSTGGGCIGKKRFAEDLYGWNLLNNDWIIWYHIISRMILTYIQPISLFLAVKEQVLSFHSAGFYLVSIWFLWFHSADISLAGARLLEAGESQMRLRWIDESFFANSQAALLGF